MSEPMTDGRLEEIRGSVSESMDRSPWWRTRLLECVREIDRLKAEAAQMIPLAHKHCFPSEGGRCACGNGGIAMVLDGKEFIDSSCIILPKGGSGTAPPKGWEKLSSLFSAQTATASPYLCGRCLAPLAEAYCPKCDGDEHVSKGRAGKLCTHPKCQKLATQRVETGKYAFESYMCDFHAADLQWLLGHLSLKWEVKVAPIEEKVNG